MTGLVGAIFGGLGSLIQMVAGGGGKTQVIQPPPTVTRDDAAAAQSAQDALSRRKGAAADMLTGTRGAEAASGTTGKFVVGN